MQAMSTVTDPRLYSIENDTVPTSLFKHPCGQSVQRLIVDLQNECDAKKSIAQLHWLSCVPGRRVQSLHTA